MATINLLPRKEFEIIFHEGKKVEKIISGKFSNWAMKRLCDKLKMNRKEIREAFNSEDLAENIYAELLLCAVEYKTRLERKEFTFLDVDAYEWIDSIGGFNSKDFFYLIVHAFDEGQEKEDAKKKAMEILSLNGTNSGQSVTQPE